jgi:hypothetical protein
MQHKTCWCSFLTFQMAHEMPEPSSSWVTRLPAKYQLPYKFHYVSSTHQGETNPLVRCCLEPETPYFIIKIERIERCVIVHLVRPLCSRYRLPDHYANILSDDDIEAVNSRRLLHVLIKRSRPDNPGVYDLFIE